MNRFVIAAAAAAALGLGTAGKADAQYVYRWTQATPYGGVVSTNQVYGPFGAQTYNSYYSPYAGVRTQAYGADVFGNYYNQAYGSSPFYGTYNRGYGYAAPNFYNPYGGAYGYNYYRFR
jgi:hypothetical protein